MAKGNMLLGQAIGSVGSLTFSRSNGKQIIKAKPEQVKNPQSKAQMIQRIILNTIAQAYSKMSAITDHSFEGIPAGQQSMSYFMKRNLALLRYELSEIGDLNASAPCFVPLGNNGMASNSYIIAKGNLPEIIPTVGTGGVTIALSANTYEAVLAATGMSRGEQLTIVTVSGDELTQQRFNYSRIILDPVDAQGVAQDLSVAFIADGAINCPNSRNENTGHTYDFSDGEFEVSVLGSDINMAACIASRQKENGEWLRSNAALILADGASVGYTMQDALDAFAAGGLDVESSRYLNNARKMVGSVAGSEPATAPAAPVISGNEQFSDPQEITITAVSGAEIYYTNDGSTPTTASTHYAAPFNIVASQTIKAIAVKNGLSSEVTTKVFTYSSGGDDEIPSSGGQG